MPEPVTAADCRLLLSLLKFAIVAPDQRERVEAWLEAKRDALSPPQDTYDRDADIWQRMRPRATDKVNGVPRYMLDDE